MYRKKYCLIILVILSILYASSLGLSFEPKTLLREYEPILYLYPNVEYDEYVPMNLEPYVEERCSLWRKYVNRPISSFRGFLFLFNSIFASKTIPASADMELAVPRPNLPASK